MKNKIEEFNGEYAFLSNFYHGPLVFEDVKYLNSESAYQAQKIDNVSNKKALIQEFTNISPKMAKRLGRKVPMRKDWDIVKLDIMYRIVKAKFTQNDHLAVRLLATGDKELIEGNYWNDTYWGICRGRGENNLGKILMRVRKEIGG